MLDNNKKKNSQSKTITHNYTLFLWMMIIFKEAPIIT